MNLDENIYQYRTRKNMSQGDLADALGVSRQSVSKWENNSAVPDLDKLVKLSELFDISLDELVGRGKDPIPTPPAPAKTEPETKVIYIEKPALPVVSKQQRIGGILLACAFLYALILYNGRFDITETFFMVVPVAACGILYLTTVHSLFYCGWLAAGAYWGHFFILFPRWEYHPFLIILGVILAAAMAAWTIRIHRKGILHIPTWLWVIGGLILLGLFILLCMNCIPSLGVSSAEATAIPGRK